jgi:hypothetical protein
MDRGAESAGKIEALAIGANPKEDTKFGYTVQDNGWARFRK